MGRDGAPRPLPARFRAVAAAGIVCHDPAIVSCQGPVGGLEIDSHAPSEPDARVALARTAWVNFDCPTHQEATLRDRDHEPHQGPLHALDSLSELPRAPSTAPTLPAAGVIFLPTDSLNRADLDTGRERVFTPAARFDGLVHLTLMF